MNPPTIVDRLPLVWNSRGEEVHPQTTEKERQTQSSVAGGSKAEKHVYICMTMCTNTYVLFFFSWHDMYVNLILGSVRFFHRYVLRPPESEVVFISLRG